MFLLHSGQAPTLVNITKQEPGYLERSLRSCETRMAAEVNTAERQEKNKFLATAVAHSRSDKGESFPF